MKTKRYLQAFKQAFKNGWWLLAGALLWTGCAGILTTGSGRLADYSLSGKPVDKIEIHSGFQVEVRYGKEFAATVTADDNLWPHLKVEVSEGKLYLGVQPFVLVMSGTLKATVTLPAPTEIAASGASRVSIGRFLIAQPFLLRLSGASLAQIECLEAQTIHASLSGSSQLSGQLQAKAIDIKLSGASQSTANAITTDLRMQINGASKAQMNGNSDVLQIDLSGASQAALGGLFANDVVAKLSGASQSIVYATKTLQATLSGASQFNCATSANPN